MTTLSTAELLRRIPEGLRRAVAEADPREFARRQRLEEEQRRERARSQLMRRTGVTDERLARAPRPTEREAQAWAELSSGRCRGLYLWGPVGRGKTWFAQGVAMAAAEAGSTARVLTDEGMADELLGVVKERELYAAARRRLERAGLLVLDDLGKAKPTDWVLQQVYAVLDRRYGAMLPVVATSQYPLDRLVGALARLGGKEMAEAIMSRLSSCATMHLDGPHDLRLEQRRPLLVRGAIA